MRRTFLMVASIATAFAICGCNKDEIKPSIESGITLNASINGSSTSKATIGGESGWKFSFETGDNISVTNNQISTYYSFTKGDTNFSSSDAQTTDAQADWYAFFPETSITLTGQTGTKDVAADHLGYAGKQENVPAHTKSLSMTLNPQMAVIEVVSQRSNIDIKAKAGDNYITGMSAAIKEDTPSFTVETSTDESSLIQQANPGTYYIAVPAGSAFDIYDGDFKLKEIAADKLKAGNHYKLTVSPRITVSEILVTLGVSLNSSYTITVTSDGDWGSNTSNDWSINPTKGNKGITTVTITAKNENTSGSEQTLDDLIFTLTGTSTTATVKVEQAACLAAGTRITMSDGSYKNVEDIAEGDMVRTFDHEAGEISSARVCQAWKGDGKCIPLSLTFASGNMLSIVGTHDLLCESTRKYVRINSANAADYVGKRFYNAETGAWDTLVCYEIGMKPVEYYCIYTAKHMNCLTEGMLSCPDYGDYVLNIYEMDENLKADAAQLAADIAKYGLLDVERDFPECIQYKDIMEDLGCQYIYIAVGKGLIPESAIETIIAYCCGV